MRWNDNKCSQRVALKGGNPKQNYYHQRFLSEDHHGLLENCKITMIDKTVFSDPNRSEFYRMYGLKLLRRWDWIFVIFLRDIYLAFTFQWSHLGLYLRFSTFLLVDLMCSCNCNCNFDISSQFLISFLFVYHQKYFTPIIIKKI